MITIQNSVLPAKGYSAMTLWPFVLCRHTLSARTRRHEAIHGSQQREMLSIGLALAALLWALGAGWWSLLALPLFFWLYALDYLVRIALLRSHAEAYSNIAFEQEAYLHEQEEDYLARRRPFAWIRYDARTTYRRH